MNVEFDIIASMSSELPRMIVQRGAAAISHRPESLRMAEQDLQFELLQIENDRAEGRCLVPVGDHSCVGIDGGPQPAIATLRI